MRRYTIVVVSIILILVACWSPWLTKSAAQSLAVNYFTDYNSSVSDGCGLSCENCGVKSIHWIPFGKQVTLEYACGGPIDRNKIPPHYQTTATVSFIGTVTMKLFKK